MRKLQQHNWVTQSRSENSVQCTECGYRVAVSNDEETKNGSKHVPEELTIYTDRVSKMDPEHATYLCKVWGVKCVTPKKKRT